MATGAGGDPPAWAKTIIDDGMNKVEAATTSNPPGATVYNVVTVMPDEDDADYDGSRKWTPAAAKLLLSNFEMRQDEFNDPHVKNKKIWEEITAALNKHGHKFQVHQVEQKWRNLLRQYKYTVLRNESVSCRKKPKKSFLHDEIQRIESKMQRTDEQDESDGLDVGVKRIKTNNVESPFIVAPVVRKTPRPILPGPAPTPVEVKPYVANKKEKTSFQSLQPDFQKLDSGQDKRFTLFNEMISRHHREKMEALDQIIELLTKN